MEIILRERNYDHVPFPQILAMVERYQGIARVKERAQAFTEKAGGIIGEFPGSPYHRALYSVTGLITWRDHDLALSGPAPKRRRPCVRHSVRSALSAHSYPVRPAKAVDPHPRRRPLLDFWRIAPRTCASGGTRSKIQGPYRASTVRWCLRVFRLWSNSSRRNRVYSAITPRLHSGPLAMPLRKELENRTLGSSVDPLLSALSIAAFASFRTAALLRRRGLFAPDT